MKISNKFIGISGATLMALSTFNASATAVFAETANNNPKIENNNKEKKDNKQVNTKAENKNVTQEDNSPLHVKSADSPVPRKKYSAMGPGYYTQGAIDFYNSIGHYNPFMSLYISPQQSQFINRIKPTVLTAKQYGLLPSIMGAQAILESQWGTAAPGHNLFGIKWTGTGPYAYSGTREFGNGSYYNTGARFRAYPSDHASMVDYINFFKENPRYHNIFGQTDYHVVAKLLYQDGYATDPNYPWKIVNIIESNGLASWDHEAGGSAVASTPVGTIPEPEKIAQIVYKPGYGVLAFQNTGKSIAGSNYKFKDGTHWKVVNTKVINGEEMYLVGNNTYIPKKYTSHYDNGIITIHYQPNYGVNALHADGTQVKGSNKKFKTGSRWKVKYTRVINGEICYLVGNDEFIPKKYTQWGKGE